MPNERAEASQAFEVPFNKLLKAMGGPRLDGSFIQRDTCGVFPIRKDAQPRVSRTAQVPAHF